VACGVDYQTQLLLVGQNPDGSTRVSAHLIIETPFVLRDTAGAGYRERQARLGAARLGAA
jgi:hypothetical protein